jgi:hypothetical protein
MCARCIKYFRLARFWISISWFVSLALCQDTLVDATLTAEESGVLQELDLEKIRETLFPDRAHRHILPPGQYKRELSYGGAVYNTTVPCVKCQGLKACSVLNGLMIQEVYYPRDLDRLGTCVVLEALGNRVMNEVFGPGGIFRDTATCRGKLISREGVRRHHESIPSVSIDHVRSQRALHSPISRTTFNCTTFLSTGTLFPLLTCSPMLSDRNDDAIPVSILGQ